MLSATLLAAIVLLTRCPGPRKTSGPAVDNEKNVAGILDSAALISHLAALTSAEMAGRETATPGNKLAQEYIVQEFGRLGLNNFNSSFYQAFPIANDSGKNIIGWLQGTVYPESYIVISAHYDHLGTRNGQVYPGADDNASGTAALMTIARYFTTHEPQHSLIFAAFDAEEKGLVGSRYFADHSPVPLEKISIDINMDMVSRNDKNEIYACGIFHYPFLQSYVDSIKQMTAIHLLTGHDNPAEGAQQNWTNQSDHFAFHQKKIPFLYFGVEDHPDYHKPGDTFEKIDQHFYYQVCNMIAGGILLFDRKKTLQ